MPGTYTIDSAATFATALLMSSAPKEKFGENGRQDTNAEGTPKWTVAVAVTFAANGSMTPVSEVLTITVTSRTDPAQGIAPGSPVLLEGLKVGITPPEKRGDRIVGGKVWHSASGLRSMAVRPAKGEAA